MLGLFVRATMSEACAELEQALCNLGVITEETSKSIENTGCELVEQLIDATKKDEAMSEWLAITSQGQKRQQDGETDNGDHENDHANNRRICENGAGLKSSGSMSIFFAPK
jgi:hypothetical protein